MIQWFCDFMISYSEKKKFLPTAEAFIYHIFSCLFAVDVLPTVCVASWHAQELSAINQLKLFGQLYPCFSPLCPCTAAGCVPMSGWEYSVMGRGVKLQVQLTCHVAAPGRNPASDGNPALSPAVTTLLFISSWITFSYLFQFTSFSRDVSASVSGSALLITCEY